MRLVCGVLILAALSMWRADPASAQQLDHYLCYRATGPITIGGKLDEPSWQRAPRSGPFVHLVTGEPIPPMLESRATLLWDDAYLYVAITEKEEDVKGYMTERDSKIYGDWMDAEVFITSSDTSDTYYEFEVNALNTIYEVFWVFEHARVPGTIWRDAPEWDPETQNVIGGISSGRWGFLDWDFPGLVSAVYVDGTLNQPDDTDTGWTVELAFPWQGMTLLADGRSLPPQAGDVWRVDCSRFGYGRVTPEVEAELPSLLGWAWNRHGLWNSHMPEKFTYVHFATDGVEAVPRLVSAEIAPSVARAGEATLVEVFAKLDLSPQAASALRAVRVDLSAVGGPADVAMADAGEGRYTARHTIMPSANGPYRVPVVMQTTYAWDVAGTGYRLASLDMEVYPAEDLSIYDEGPAEGWSVEVLGAESNTEATAFVHTGSFSHAILLPTMVTYAFDDPEGVDLFGYTHLEFWINGGDGTGQDPRIDGRKLSNWGVVVEPNTWKKVSIPASEFPDPLTSFYVGGVRQDRFYIDDMKLVAAEVELPPTAVEEAASTSAVPVGYALFGNYPNPFNAETVIRYEVRDAGAVRLRVYDLTGQAVRTLVDGRATAGVHSAVWDGKDDAGRDAASGIYVCRMVAGDYASARNMLLLR